MISFDVYPVPLPCAGGVALQVTSSNPKLTYYVTAQPIYKTASNGSLDNPYGVIAGLTKSVISVRDPGEAIYQPNPYDITEPGQLVLYGASFTNTPLPHYIAKSPTPGAPQTDLTQAQFNVQAFNAALALSTWKQPALIHCSTGDRASAAFGVFLIVSGGYTNLQALDFATTRLVLQNEAFKTFLRYFEKP